MQRTVVAVYFTVLKVIMGVTWVWFGVAPDFSQSAWYRH